MKVLLVDDDAEWRGLLRNALRAHGVEVAACERGEQALCEAKSGSFDAILLDWMLPDIDGPSICQALRGQGLAVPILLVSARSGVSERIAGLDAGANDYIVKPFDVGELVARLRAAVRRARLLEAGLAGTGPAGCLSCSSKELERCDQDAGWRWERQGSSWRRAGRTFSPSRSRPAR